ncbi:PilZ domain-containing protein [Methylotenera mobilis]|uniref:Cyclic diguanosine monophosphate-binding protein n=1 Tax=Methylotenera mobilis (strain JLW8 / ATCC BAA-1282 / DSM 17540) TaxID=583345 RepID=C6WUG3_METML|nr:PilZ domain-containing protein [Methylotenera mobilis]ACT47562.1 type IV pilus assembly PilZ [Methylotenera mobilis JLW8]
MLTTESRHYSRIQFNAAVELNIRLLEDIHTAHLLDISLKGALVETDTPISSFIQMRSCLMTLTLGNNGEKITMQGKVVHHAGRLVGLEALHMDVDSMTNLRKLILLNTGSEDLLGTELSHMLNSIKMRA